jgi:hypothetical protein
MVTLDNLWLKEIVVITEKKEGSEIQTRNDYLEVSHQYLLVYEVKK